MQPTSKKQLYVLEKIWRHKPDIKLDEHSLNEVLIRPCNVSYQTYRKFALGFSIKQLCIVHQGCVLSWYPKWKNMNVHQPDFKTLEEFMIYANLNKCVFPLIENWIVVDYNYTSYYVKTIDLKTNDILFDSVDKVMKKLSES